MADDIASIITGIVAFLAGGAMAFMVSRASYRKSDMGVDDIQDRARQQARDIEGATRQAFQIRLSDIRNRMRDGELFGGHE